MDVLIDTTAAFAYWAGIFVQTCDDVSPTDREPRAAFGDGGVLLNSLRPDHFPRVVVAVGDVDALGDHWRTTDVVATGSLFVDIACVRILTGEIKAEAAWRLPEGERKVMVLTRAVPDMLDRDEDAVWNAVGIEEWLVLISPVVV